MNKEELILSFQQNHVEFLSFIEHLDLNDFETSVLDKWTPGQQLEHIYLCLNPIDQSLRAKEFIEQKFGTINRECLSYDETITNYLKALANGGKAPEQFVPSLIPYKEKETKIDAISNQLLSIKKSFGNYSEEEFETLSLPHPLLGKMSLKELFYLMSYHATHHLVQTKKNIAIK